MRNQRIVMILLVVFAAGCRTPGRDKGGSDARAVEGEENPDMMRESAVAAPIVRTDSFTGSNRGKSLDELTHLNVCSFNISFLGHWNAEDKRSEELVDVLKPCDVVALQELVAPPLFTAIDVDGAMYQWFPKETCDASQAEIREREAFCQENVDKFGQWWESCAPPEGIKTLSRSYKPKGEQFKEDVFKGDCQARMFVGAMHDAGFRYMLSTGDTGKNYRHNNSTSSDWFVVFYRPEYLEPIPEGKGPTGWTLVETNGRFRPCGNPDPEETGGLDPQDNPISKCLVKNPVFDRVPYAFTMRTKPRNDGKSLSFSLINVHLTATLDTSREGFEAAGIDRAEEFKTIHKWIDKQMELYPERDFIILGDTNIATIEELDLIMEPSNNPNGFVSLNDALHKTNTGGTPMPFDHVMLNPEVTPVGKAPDGRLEFEILDITAPTLFDYEGEMGGNQNAFFKTYSDHVPVKFRLLFETDDEWSQGD